MRIGILGVGGMGNRHTQQYRKMEGVEIAFYDLSAEQSDEYAKRWDVEPKASAEDLLSWSDVVDVCLPTDVHKDACLRAISEGRAVFVEKPLTRTYEDALEVVQTAERSSVPLGVGQVVRYFPEFKTGHDVVANGGIGKPAAARTRRGGPTPTGASEWFLDYSRSGGVLLDLAVHDFDWLRWTLGEVKHLYSRSVGLTRRSGPDYALTVLTFESGAIGHVEATWMDPSGFRTTFEVCGGDGMVHFDSRETASLRTHAGGKTALESNIAPLDDPYYQEIDGFLKAVKAGTPPPVTGHDGLMAVSISLAAVESAETGKIVAPKRP